MITQLKNQFFRAAFLTLIYCLILLTLFTPNAPLSVLGVWRFVAVAFISGILFGICYPYIWQFLTWPAPVNIVVTSLLNFACGFVTVYLISQEMVTVITPYWWAILAIEIIGHTITFYFYRSSQNKKIAAELNKRKETW